MFTDLTLFRFFLVFALLTTTYSQNTGNEVSQLEQFYYNKCLSQTGSINAFEKLRNDVYETFQYLKLVFQLLPNQIDTFCDKEKSNLEYRIKEIKNDLKSCTTPNEEYFGGFVKESFEEFLHFFCHNDGQYTKRLFNSETASCRKKIEESDSKELEYCLNRIFPPSKKYIAQKELCESISVGRKCMEQLITLKCPNSENVKNLNSVFFRYINKPCSSCMFLSSQFIIVGLLLVHILMR